MLAREPELTKPCTTAAPTAIATASGTTTSASLRLGRRRRRGSPASTCWRSPSGATGGFARSAATSPSYPSNALVSVADIGHLLFQSLQGLAEPGRASRPADAEHPRRARPVELEQHAQRHDLALGRCQPLQGALDLGGQALGEDGVLERRLVAAVGLLAPLPP